MPESSSRLACKPFRGAGVSAVQYLCQPVPDVAVDIVLLCLVEDFMPAAIVKPVFQGEVALFHVPADEALNRDGLAADGGRRFRR